MVADKLIKDARLVDDKSVEDARLVDDKSVEDECLVDKSVEDEWLNGMLIGDDGLVVGNSVESNRPRDGEPLEDVMLGRLTGSVVLAFTPCMRPVSRRD